MSADKLDPKALKEFADLMSQIGVDAQGVDAA